MQRHGLSVRAIREARYPAGGRPHLVTTGYQVGEHDGADLGGALETVRKAKAPADQGRMTGWLAELSVQVAFCAQTDFTTDLTLQVYARNLAEYPADVARDVLAEWPARSKWWPTWHELKERLDEKSRPRRVLERELARRMREERSAEPERAYDPTIAEGLSALAASLKSPTGGSSE